MRQVVSALIPVIASDEEVRPLSLTAASAPVETLPTTAERLAKSLRDGNIGRGGASVHYLSDIAVDLAHIDHPNSGFCRQVAVIEHGRRCSVVILGAEQVGAAHAVDIPASRCDLRVRRDPRRGWSSGLRGWRSWRWRCLLLRSGRLCACGETAHQQNCDELISHNCPLAKYRRLAEAASVLGRLPLVITGYCPQ